MAGVSLLGLKRRQKTVTSTRKITKAMGLVSTSKYQKARIRLAANDRHYISFQEIVDEILSSADPHEEETGIFLKTPNPGKRKLFIIFNSVKGLCAGYNTQVGAKALELIRAEALEPYIIFTGTRGVSDLKKSITPEHMEHLNFGDLPDFDDTEELFDHTIGLYRNGYVSEVVVIYTKYLSALRDEVRADVILPFAGQEESKQTESKVIFDFDPSAAEMEDRIFTMFLREKLYNILLHAKTAEHSTRMKAMDSANKNADEILSDLNKQLNRVRQTAITQEITEIVGGAEALK